MLEETVVPVWMLVKVMFAPPTWLRIACPCNCVVDRSAANTPPTSTDANRTNPSAIAIDFGIIACSPLLEESKEDHPGLAPE
jgi:hypothetical protein